MSDTTIMASSGAQCNHIDHVKTQLPYASSVAIISGISFIIAGFAAAAAQGSDASYGITVVATLASGLGLMAAMLVAVYFMNKKGVLDKVDAKFGEIAAKLSIKGKKATREVIAAEEAEEAALAAEDAKAEKEAKEAEDVKAD